MQFLVSVILSDIEACTPFLNEHLAYLKHHLNNGDFLTYGPYIKKPTAAGFSLKVIRLKH